VLTHRETGAIELILDVVADDELLERKQDRRVHVLLN
jgi:hypothetical protein